MPYMFFGERPSFYRIYWRSKYLSRCHRGSLLNIHWVKICEVLTVWVGREHIMVIKRPVQELTAQQKSCDYDPDTWISNSVPHCSHWTTLLSLLLRKDQFHSNDFILKDNLKGGSGDPSKDTNDGGYRDEVTNTVSTLKKWIQHAKALSSEKNILSWDSCRLTSI